MKNALYAAVFLFAISCSSPSTPDNGISTDSTAIAHGRQAFSEKCSGCHNFLQDGIGPQLSGITTDHPSKWLASFIREPQKMIDSGDSTAVELFKQYKALMPSFASMPDEEMNNLLAFLNTHKREDKVLVEEDTHDLKNPIPDTIQMSDLVVGVEPFAQIPASSSDAPLTRIIKLDYQPGTNDLFVLDLRGKLYKLVNGKPEVYMDMSAFRPKFINQPGLATGFGSFTFHPEFAKNGTFYTTHVEPAATSKADFSYPDSIAEVMQWVLTEWKASSPGAFPFSGNGREIFRIKMPTGIHGVQEIAFNKKSKPGDEDYGLLYIGIGDGGSTEIGDPLLSPQPKTVWGSIIRIDPAGKNGRNGQYGIPPKNPFSNRSGDGFAPEVYAWGFRNPHKFSWTKSGELFAVNIGEHNIESVNIIKPGNFYGWPIREGTFMEHFYNDKGKVYPLPADDTSFHVTYPAAEFDHDEGTAISGGFEYQGADVPELKGKYVFGDIGTGKLFYVNMKDLKPGKPATIKKWRISMNGRPTSLAELCKNTRVDMRYGMDSKGELYLFTKQDGKIYKLVKP